MLKIFEVLPLLGAGVCFAIWQFRDVRRAKEITRKQRQEQQEQIAKTNPEPHSFHEKSESHGH